VVPVGSTFVPESDNLRTALDSALTSPYGLAVAVAPGTGRFAGVVSAGEILGQVADARAATAESIALRPEPETRPEPGEGQLDDDLRPELAEGPDEGASTGSARMDGPEDDLRPESGDLRSESDEGAQGKEVHPQPVKGPQDDSDSAEASEEVGATGSTRLDELQLSAEPVASPVTGPEPIDEPDDRGSGSTALGEEREPHRDHVR
jgi:osmoprotectant transport system ATP-binding protein